MAQQFLCDLSGVAATDDEMEGVDVAEGDDDEIPLGWTKVTITTRHANPARERVEQIAANVSAMARAALAAEGMPKRDARMLAEVQSAAAFSHLLSVTPIYIDDTEEVMIASRDVVPEVGNIIDEVYSMLGLADEGIDDDEDDDDVFDVEPEPAPEGEPEVEPEPAPEVEPEPAKPAARGKTPRKK